MLRLILEERKQSQLDNMRNERDFADTMWIINYYKQLYGDTFDYLYEMDKFLEKHHSPKLIQEGKPEIFSTKRVCKNFLVQQ